jgi:NlpC/P60 family protein
MGLRADDFAGSSWSNARQRALWLESLIGGGGREPPRPIGDRRSVERFADDDAYAAGADLPLPGEDAHDALAAQGGDPALAYSVRRMQQELLMRELRGRGSAAPANDARRSAGMDSPMSGGLDEGLLELLMLIVSYLARQLGGGRDLGAMGSSGWGRGAPAAWGSVRGGGRVEPATVARAGPSSTGTGDASDFVDIARSMEGGRYVYGAKGDPRDPHPSALDCSGLVTWAAARAGIQVPNGSDNQLGACEKISVERALQTKGALLFVPGQHVAISLGDGLHTIEAMDPADGIKVGDGRGRFTAGGLMPGMSYSR